MPSRADSLPSTFAEPLRLATWARPKTPLSQEDAGFFAGSTLAVLDAIVRQDLPGAGAWRQRLALTAAAATGRQTGRGEDEALIRDAWMLRRPADDPGPAGRTLRAWRALARPTATLSPALIDDVARDFGIAIGDRTEALLEALNTPGRSGSPVAAAAAAAARALAVVPDGEALAHWIADLVLARRLGWRTPVPLLAAFAAHPTLRAGGTSKRIRPGEGTWPLIATQAYGLAATAAIDRATDLARRASAVTLLAPKLRAKGSAAIVENLLGDDCLAPSIRIGQMTDRGLRRIFDRLVAAGVVRELTGRPAFRLYGL